MTSAESEKLTLLEWQVVGKGGRGKCGEMSGVGLNFCPFLFQTVKRVRKCDIIDST